ncbi:MAG: hypothetical protein K2O40_02530 [Lachnospiraceae bacterium]|nr:hypothetical protein [Lachnospiraceae bacterium]
MKFKKVLATTMAATMVMASAMTVCAADQYPNLVAANAHVLVAGDDNVTSITGDYSAESVRGVVVTTPVEDVKKALGLVHGQRASVVIYDAEMKASPEAIACLEAAEESAGATEVASLYFELGAKEDGKWLTNITDGTVTVKVGLPKNADKTKTYSVIRVEQNGVVTVLNDLDTSDKTVTFEAVTGVGVYGIVTDVTNAAAIAPVVPVETPAAESTEAAAVEDETAVEVTVEEKEAVLVETPESEAETAEETVTAEETEMVSFQF